MMINSEGARPTPTGERVIRRALSRRLKIRNWIYKRLLNEVKWIRWQIRLADILKQREEMLADPPQVGGGIHGRGKAPPYPPRGVVIRGGKAPGGAPVPPPVGHKHPPKPPPAPKLFEFWCNHCDVWSTEMHDHVHEGRPPSSARREKH